MKKVALQSHELVSTHAFPTAGMANEAGISPAVCAKHLLTTFQSLPMRTSEKKSTKETAPQQPSSATIATAASPTWVTDVIVPL